MGPTQALRVVGGAALVTFVGIAVTPLPDLLNRWMVVRARLDRAAAIVVLGGGGVRPDGGLTGTSLRRAITGLHLYRMGLAPVLVFSGSPPGPSGSEADARAALARECEISPAAMLTISTARTTHEEGERIAGLLHPRGIRKILLVSDAQGMARAMGVFTAAGFEVLPAPTLDVPEMGGGPGDRLDLMRRVLQEAVAWLYYRIAGYL